MRTALLLLTLGLVLVLPKAGVAQLARVPGPHHEAPTPTLGVEPAVLPYAEQMPAFSGGEAALHNYLLTKIKYPAEAMRRGQSGTVVVQFVVDEQGRVLDPAVVKTSSDDFAAEAIRLVRLMPWWTPGRQLGQPVRVRCTLPIQFTFRR